MDGLLFDTERVYQQTWQELALEKGMKLNSSFAKDISGTNGQHMCRVIEQHYHVPDETAITDECMVRIRKKLSLHVPVKQGVHEILDFFQKKEIRIAVASSSTSRQIESNLETAGIRKHFIGELYQISSHPIIVLCYNVLWVFRSLIFSLIRVNNSRGEEIHKEKLISDKYSLFGS